jgi:hypothetical protein
MSLSKECQVYHLTPRGWEEGSFYGDALGGRKEVPTPADRVLTIACYDELPSAFSEPFIYDRALWESENKKLVRRLKCQFGEKPEWFGYRMMAD